MFWVTWVRCLRNSQERGPKMVGTEWWARPERSSRDVPAVMGCAHAPPPAGRLKAGWHAGSYEAGGGLLFLAVDSVSAHHAVNSARPCFIAVSKGHEPSPELLHRRGSPEQDLTRHARDAGRSQSPRGRGTSCGGRDPRPGNRPGAATHHKQMQQPGCGGPHATGLAGRVLGGGMGGMVVRTTMVRAGSWAGSTTIHRSRSHPGDCICPLLAPQACPDGSGLGRGTWAWPGS